MRETEREHGIGSAKSFDNRFDLLLSDTHWQLRLTYAFHASFGQYYNQSDNMFGETPVFLRPNFQKIISYESGIVWQSYFELFFR